MIVNAVTLTTKKTDGKGGKRVEERAGCGKGGIEGEKRRT
jgi:hypothetical protein